MKKTVIKISGIGMAFVFILLSAVWAGLALLYTTPQNGLHIALASCSALASLIALAALLSERWRLRGTAGAENAGDILFTIRFD